MQAKTRFGFWESPISAEMVASQGVRFSQVKVDASFVYWLEQRPSEVGRQVIVRQSLMTKITEDITTTKFSVRSRVHEYGGGDYIVKNGVVYFVNEQDQAIYQQKPQQPPMRLSPLARDKQYRFADLLVTNDQRYVIAIRETHIKNQPVINELIVLDVLLRVVHVLACGDDFYASPTLDNTETQLAWLSWSHPNMPWDETKLWSATVQNNFTVTDINCLVSNKNESLYQPQFHPEGDLYVVSDRTGFWNIYRVQGAVLEPITRLKMDCGTTQWVFGTNTYAFSKEGRLFVIATKQAVQQIGEVINGCFIPFAIDATTIEPYLAVFKDNLFFLGATTCRVLTLFDYSLQSHALMAVANSSDVKINITYLSKPLTIIFPTTDHQQAQAFFYPPTNPNYLMKEAELPPLIVCCHSGPIAATDTAFNLKIQFWTSRGFAVVDVNYRGSVGFGRAYRDALKTQWGVVDVADCVNAARYLVKKQWVDSNRLLIRGSSAGGFTALCALVSCDDFVAGASYYGVTDLTALLADTPKFEAKTVESLVGKYPKEAKLYQERSPVFYANKITAPVIFFQGLQDPVVPPSQAERMVAAMKASHVPCRYVTFAQERHGFKLAETIIKALTEELAFYQEALYTGAF